MEPLENADGISRAELLQRVTLMEQMIAEGRRATGSYAWMFVLWGLVDLGGLGLERLQPGKLWIWPTVIVTGFVLQFAGMVVVRKSGFPEGTTVKSKSIGAVWGIMGTGVLLYVAGAMARGVVFETSYVPAILMMVGMAHAISARILRWWAQAAAAAVWWIGGLATYFVRGEAEFWLVAAVMFFGLVVFGMYAMMRERRCGPPAVARHA